MPVTTQRKVGISQLSGRWEAGLLRGGTIKPPLILIILTLVLTACSSGGPVHVHHIPSPTPHKVVMTR